jgi:hypothetical protein
MEYPKSIGRIPKSSVRPTYIGNKSESDVLSGFHPTSDSYRTNLSDESNHPSNLSNLSNL